MKTVETAVFVVLASCATSLALASGREGEQYVGAVLLIVLIVVAVFAACMVAGISVGVVQARRKGDSTLKGCAVGILRGLLYFVLVCVALTGLTSLLGFLWIIYALASTW